MKLLFGQALNICLNRHRANTNRNVLSAKTFHLYRKWRCLLWPANCIAIPLMAFKTRDESLFLALHYWATLTAPSRLSKLRKRCTKAEKLSAHIECLGGSIHWLIIDISFVHRADIDMAIHFASTAPLYIRNREWLDVSKLLVNLLICSCWVC